MKHQLFEVSIKAVITEPDNRVLIVKERGGKWLLPGGRMQSNETVDQTLRRELQEEIGLTKPVIGHVTGVDTGLKRAQPILVIVYRVACPQGFQVRLSEEHDEFQWVATDELESVDFAVEETKHDILLACGESPHATGG